MLGLPTTSSLSSPPASTPEGRDRILISTTDLKSWERKLRHLLEITSAHSIYEMKEYIKYYPANYKSLDHFQLLVM